jgi:hypothetical protein
MHLSPLQLKWSVPEETGGEPILQYVLEMQPAPLGWEGPANPEVRGVAMWRINRRKKRPRSWHSCLLLLLLQHEFGSVFPLARASMRCTVVMTSPSRSHALPRACVTHSA